RDPRTKARGAPQGLTFRPRGDFRGAEPSILLRADGAAGDRMEPAGVAHHAGTLRSSAQYDRDQQDSGSAGHAEAGGRVCDVSRDAALETSSRAAGRAAMRAHASF